MTIDETIRHCREVANEHLQLAEWLEELKKLRGWRTPKKPIDDEQKMRWTCPNCAEVVAEYYKGVPKHYCPNCGQRLDWSVE